MIIIIMIIYIHKCNQCCKKTIFLAFFFLHFFCNFSHGAGHIQGGKKKEEMEV